MAKHILITLVVTLTLGFVAFGVEAAEKTTGGMGIAFGANEIVGVHVKNPQGEVLGRVSDFVVDAEGKASLIILSHGGFLRIGEKETAIPFDALSYDQTATTLILDTTREKLTAAPAFKMSDLSDPRRAEEIYRHFGLQPYWTEGGELFKGLGQPLEEQAAPTIEDDPFRYIGP
jgi:sporulation protein YlmC with PRC-barrel domain